MNKVFIISKNENTHEHKGCVSYANENGFEIVMTEFVHGEQEKDNAICKVVNMARREEINTVLVYDTTSISRYPEKLVAQLEKMLDNSISVITVVGGEISRDDEFFRQFNIFKVLSVSCHEKGCEE